MTLISWQNGGPVMRSGAVGTEASCCCEGTCDTKAASAGGAGTTETTYLFPSSAQQIRFTWNAFTIPDQFIVEACGTQYIDTGSVSGTGYDCFTKPAGCTSVKVTVIGPDGTWWEYTIGCSDCTEPPPQPSCGCGQYVTIDDATCGATTTVSLCTGGTPELPQYNEYNLLVTLPCDCINQASLQAISNQIVGLPDELVTTYNGCDAVIATSECQQLTYSTGTNASGGCCVKMRTTYRRIKYAYVYSPDTCQWTLIYTWPIEVQLGGIVDTGPNCDCADPPEADCTPPSCPGFALPDGNTCDCYGTFP